MTLAQLITNIGDVVTASTSWIGEVATCVTDNPLLLFSVVIGFVGIGIGLFKRLFNAM